MFDRNYTKWPTEVQVIAHFQRKKSKIYLEVCKLAWLLKEYHAPPILGTRSSFKLDLKNYIKVTYAYMYLLNGFWKTIHLIETYTFKIFVPN